MQIPVVAVVLPVVVGHFTTNRCILWPGLNECECVSVCVLVCV